MTTATKKPDAYAVRLAVQPIVAEYLFAKAYAQTMREVIDDRHLPLLESARIVDDRGQVILNTQRLYRAADGQDEQIAAFYAACNAANVAAGWTGDPEHCPALCADTDRVKAENALLDAGFAAMGSPSLAQYAWGEKRKQAIDLFVELAQAKQ